MMVASLRPAYMALFIAALLLSAGTVQAGEPIAIVTSPTSSLSQVSREEVAALFLGSIHLENGGDQVVALDQRDEAIREFFYAHVARRSLIQVRAHWARMVFTGRGRPPKQLSVDELIQMLQSNPSVVTYLPLSKANGFKVLMTIQNDANPDAAE